MSSSRGCYADVMSKSIRIGAAHRKRNPCGRMHHLIRLCTGDYHRSECTIDHHCSFFSLVSLLDAMRLPLPMRLRALTVRVNLPHDKMVLDCFLDLFLTVYRFAMAIFAIRTVSVFCYSFQQMNRITLVRLPSSTIIPS